MQIPSVKLEVWFGFLSRNQACQYHVSPARTETFPEAVGTTERSTSRENWPDAPVLSAPRTRQRC